MSLANAITFDRVISSLTARFDILQLSHVCIGMLGGAFEALKPRYFVISSAVNALQELRRMI